MPVMLGNKAMTCPIVEECKPNHNKGSLIVNNVLKYNEVAARLLGAEGSPIYPILVV